MASRRTRIKGIANIPQRRKTLNSTTNPEEDPKIDQDEGHVTVSEPNLNVKREENEEVPNSFESVIQEEPPAPETNANVPSVQPKIQSENNAGVQEPKPICLIRRKFIKPAIAVNAITRKSKDSEDAMKPDGGNNVENGKNNKIIILSDIITYPNQNQHIVIKAEKSENLGTNEGQKVPEVNNGRPLVNGVERDIKRLVPSSPQTVTPDIEYPIPPPSPNKINRSRIKAVPRLGQRNTSFSASESEDETRRNYRHRNDSVCSSASGLLDSNSIPECPSPQKPKEFNTVIQRKCRRTEQSRKLAEARRDFQLKFGNKTPDRHKLTMIDLIFYNPVTNPMSNDGKNKRRNTEVEENNQNNQETKVVEEAVDDPNKAGSDEENEVPAPQIKIGADGEIILDEQSLVIENKAVKKSREEMEKSQIVDGDFDTGYGVYKRAKRSKDWNKAETLKFYKALNTLGTDFTLMCELFPRRSRRELKMKFKKEEKVNKALVDKAIMQPCGFDFNQFKHQVEMEEKELQEIEKQKEREKTLRQELEAKKRKSSAASKKEPPEKQAKLKSKKKPFDILNVLDDNSDADESEGELVIDEDVDERLMQSIQKPTRSGRVPRILNRYKAPEPEDKPIRGKPGSLVVVASTGANGQPVYKVCMVTADQTKQQIGDDQDSLQKALECKENGLTSLFTLSATTTSEIDDVVENNQTIPAEEHNITIPAEEVCSPNLDAITM